MSRRIAQIIPTLDRGGAEKQMLLLALGLPREEFDVHVVVLTRSGPLEQPLREAGVPVTEIRKRGKFDPGALWRLTGQLRRLQPDLVHTWLFAANSYGRVAARRARVPSIIAGERCVDPWKTGLHHAIDRRLAAGTDWIATNSGGVRDFYVRHGLPADKFVVIPNGMPAPDSALGLAGTSGGDCPPLSRESFLRQLRLPDDARVIAAVGRLWPQKRYKDLIWAADLLKVTRDDTHLIIIGDGPQRERLLKYRQQVRITDRVHFLGVRDDVHRLLPHCSCFWLGSDYEGQSNALMEAMWAGVPPVVTDIPGNRDLVIQGESGFLVPVGDRGAFARQTNLILNDPALAERLSAQARTRIQTQFSVEQMVRRYADLYRRTIER